MFSQKCAHTTVILELYMGFSEDNNDDVFRLVYYTIVLYRAPNSYMLGLCRSLEPDY